MTGEYLGDGAVRHIDGNDALEKLVNSSQNSGVLDNLLPADSRKVLEQYSELRGMFYQKLFLGFGAL